MAASETIRRFLTEDLQEAREDAISKEVLLRAERDEALRQVKWANGHNYLLRDQNAQLKAALRALKQNRITSATYITGPDGRTTLMPLTSTGADEVKAQAIGDQSDPDLAAAMIEQSEQEFAKAYAECKASMNPPSHLDTEREGATAAAMSRKNDE